MEYFHNEWKMCFINSVQSLSIKQLDSITLYCGSVSVIIRFRALELGSYKVNLNTVYTENLLTNLSGSICRTK